jgi:hypothetical protein
MQRYCNLLTGPGYEVDLNTSNIKTDSHPFTGGEAPSVGGELEVATMSTVRVIPTNDGSWNVAGARMIPTGVRIERRALSTEKETGSAESMAGNSVFGTPPATRVRAGLPMAPRSAQVPSRAVLRAVLHSLGRSALYTFSVSRNIER